MTFSNYKSITPLDEIDPISEPTSTTVPSIAAFLLFIVEQGIQDFIPSICD